MKHIRIATRESPLALWQAQFIQVQLQTAYPDCTVTLLPMTTEGDQKLNTALSAVGGKGLFIKELEWSLRDGRADLAVHSLKDMTIDLDADFHVAAITERAEVRDAFVSNQYASIEALPLGAIVGTSSLRRQCQLKAWRSDLQIVPVRGNVNTRLKKLDEKQFDALILAAAGLQRLGFNDRIRALLPIDKMLPAAGQAALALETLSSRSDLMIAMKTLQHEATAICVQAERAVSRALGGSCHVPLAAYAQFIDAEHIHLKALVGQPDGSQLLIAEGQALAQDAETLGARVGADLLQQGAANIIAGV